MKMQALLFLTFLSSVSFSGTQIAFIEIRDKQGQILQLETGGRFSHIAISYQGRWLHSHPYRGVELVDITALEKIGHVVLVSVPGYNELTPEEVKHYLNKPYDVTYTWDGDGYYCSKLVGKVLGMKPEPMSFQASIWKGVNAEKGVGLSPDDIFRKLLSNAYRGRIIRPRCESAFY